VKAQMNRSDDDLEIVLPAGEIDSRTFQLEVRATAEAAVRDKRLTARSFPTLFELSLSEWLAWQDERIAQAREVEIDLATAGQPAGWFGRLKRRARLVAHRLVVFYVNRLAARQFEVNQEMRHELAALARHARRMGDAQRDDVAQLRAELEQLRAEIRAVTATGREE
jgi:hypothetical protein